jgi:hypothetical protein
MDEVLCAELKFISVELGMVMGLLLAIWWQIVKARLNK